MNKKVKYLAIGSLGTIAALFGFVFLIRGKLHVEAANLEAGDLLFDRVANPATLFSQTLGFYWTHMAVYMGDNKLVEVTPSTGVVLVDISSWDNEIDTMAVHVYGLSANQREGIVNFTNTQVGKGFNFTAFEHILDDDCYPRNISIDSVSWYCSEVVWAAYLSQGVDLDINDSECLVSPQAIYDRLGL